VERLFPELADFADQFVLNFFISSPLCPMPAFSLFSSFFDVIVFKTWRNLGISRDKPLVSSMAPLFLDFPAPLFSPFRLTTSSSRREVFVVLAKRMPAHFSLIFFAGHFAFFYEGDAALNG